MKKLIISITTLLSVALLTACGVKERGQVMDGGLVDFQTWCSYPNDYLMDLKATYNLEDLTKDCKSDYEKVLTITKWVSGLWQHDGENVPKKSDPLFILDQVVNHGQQYRCVEYGTVVSGCLQAQGLDSRNLNLKMKTVETEEYGAGHVGCEVYLDDIQKWVFIDAQWGAIPMIGDTPLNAYEFGEAIRKIDSKLYINWVNNVYNATDKDYIQWIEPYLYYLDSSYKNVDGNFINVMYVPEDGKEVTIFQRKYSINMDYYLRDIKLFYSK